MQDKLTQDVPPMLNNVGKRCAFEVMVTTRNQDSRARYTVARLAEVTISAPTIKEADHIEGAGPSKKEKSVEIFKFQKKNTILPLLNKTPFIITLWDRTIP